MMAKVGLSVARDCPLYTPVDVSCLCCYIRHVVCIQPYEELDRGAYFAACALWQLLIGTVAVWAVHCRYGGMRAFEAVAEVFGSETAYPELLTALEEVGTLLSGVIKWYASSGDEAAEHACGHAKAFIESRSHIHRAARVDSTGCVCLGCLGLFVDCL